MHLINFILNLTGMLLWVSWRYLPFDPIQRARPATLTGTLRRAEPLKFRRWHFLVALAVLLLLRPVFYWWVGGTMQWTLDVNLGVVNIAFRCDAFDRMLVFSLVSFADAVFQFYLVLVLLWLCGPRNVDTDPCQRFVRIQLSPMHRWPQAVVLLLPFAVAATGWIALQPLFARMGIIPSAPSWERIIEQSLVLGLSVYAGWKHAIGVVLALRFLNTYVYLGPHPIWNFVDQTGKTLLRPLAPLRLQFRRMDFAPIVAIALTYLIATFLEEGLHFRLPGTKALIDVPGLGDLFSLLMK
jgi:uncharacterized protein YggT (Ycf19 family)